MKPIKHIAYCGVISLLSFTACDDENETVKSIPVIHEAGISADNLTYGDEITFHAEISDETTPLSTLEIAMEANDISIFKKSVRTKGNHAEVNETFTIPFVKGSLKESSMKIRLEAININGYSTVQYLDNIKLVRPAFNRLTLKNNDGTVVTLTPRSGSDDIFESPEGNYSNSLQCRIYENSDESGYQWAEVNGLLGLATELDADYKFSDPLFEEVKRITFDMQNFELAFEGRRKEIMAINGTEMTNGYTKSVQSNNAVIEQTVENNEWLTVTLSLTQDQTVTFSGFNNLDAALTADYFTNTGKGYSFAGESGTYVLNYHIATNFFYIEQPLATAPAGYWLRGWGVRRPSANPSLFQTSWDWNYPYDYVYMHSIGNNRYVATVQFVPTNDADKGVNCKIFSEGVLYGEIDGGIDAKSPLMTQSSDKNLLGTAALTAGKYLLTLDMNDKTLTCENIQ